MKKGDPRCVEFPIGWYVGGEEKLIPVGSEVEGFDIIKKS